MRQVSAWLLAITLVLLAPAARAERIPHCDFGPGALAADNPHIHFHGGQIPINNIIVLMQENRSFDHYFGQLHYQGQPRVKKVPTHASNPDPTNPSGPPIMRFHKTTYCETADLDHSWNGTHEEWDNAKMDGFTRANVDSTDPNGSRTMGYYDSSDLPFYYALYSTFAMSDRYFASVLTQTFPNRFYLLAGTSFGHIKNDFPTGNPATDFTQRTIFNLLDEAGITWKVYFSQIAFADEFGYVRNHAPGNVVPFQDYLTDAGNGTLPQVSFIDPIFVAQANVENDEHPPSNIQVGEQFVEQAVNALFGSPQWSHAALFLTYDEHGGFYDHVKPPLACLPDNISPNIGAGDFSAPFNRYGIRVPAMVISPYARPHYVSHRVYDHTSILRFIETRFNLPALTGRDANADPMLKLFKFNRVSFPSPPTLPAAPLDQSQVTACSNAPPPTGL